MKRVIRNAAGVAAILSLAACGKETKTKYVDSPEGGKKIEEAKAAQTKAEAEAEVAKKEAAAQNTDDMPGLEAGK